MRTSIINVIFLFIFALIASSTPVPMENHVLPKATGELPCDVHRESYTDEQHSADQELWMQAYNGEPFDHEKLSAAQKRSIMFTCWSVFTDPGFPAKYNEFRPDFHVVMKELVDMLLEPAWAAIYDKGVESVAGTVLGIWLQWETVQGYKEMYRGVPSPVYDRQHLKSLQRLLIRAIIREKVPDNDTDMENNLAPHGLKRHNSPEGNDYDPGHMHLPKMRRLLPIISGHKSHNVHDVEMTG